MFENLISGIVKLKSEKKEAEMNRKSVIKLFAVVFILGGSIISSWVGKHFVLKIFERRQEAEVCDYVDEFAVITNRFNEGASEYFGAGLIVQDERGRLSVYPEIIKIHCKHIENCEEVDSSNSVAVCHQLPDGRCRWKVIGRLDRILKTLERFFEQSEEMFEDPYLERPLRAI